MKDQLMEKFINIFGKQKNAIRYFFAPGRINLIGEHTDYNGGYVFPAAISLGTYALAAKRQDKKIQLFSMNFPNDAVIECDIHDLKYRLDHRWANYPKGMIEIMQKEYGPLDVGMNILFFGNIPNSAGLSSSASIEMVTGVLVNQLFDCDADRIKMIQLGQQVENNYIGVQSGIMDQFAIGMGRKDQAIHLNTETLDYTYAPIVLPDYTIMIIHTNKQRSLSDSKYNERRKQCEQALHDLQQTIDIKHLGELDVATFEQYKHLIKNKTNQQRAKHAVTENARTIEALKALQQHDLQRFGRLMNESHQSLKEDYEVTGIELDTIAETAWKLPGVLGARMTGAGFGGCAIAIVHREQLDEFQKQIKQTYTKKVGYEPIFYTASISDGAKEMVEGSIIK